MQILVVYSIYVSFPEKLLVVLRDGRTLIGYLRSIDQFGMYMRPIKYMCDLLYV